MNKTAIVFPGQGAQVAYMGKEIAEHSEECMSYWKKAEEYSSLPLRKIYWETVQDEEMAKTSALQPALTCVALSLFYMYSKKHTEYSCFAGHSLGEFSALYAGNVLSSDDVLLLTARRGALMEHADTEQKGGMIAILKLPLETVEKILTSVQKNTGALLVIANYNSPVQYIISGEKSAFPALIEEVSHHKGRAIVLNVSGAFHSPLMKDAEKAFQTVLNSVQWNNATTPIYSNVTGTALSSAQDIQKALATQMTRSVRWIGIVQAMCAEEIHTYIELGAKSVLSALIKGCSQGKEITTQTFSSYKDFI